MEDEISTDPKGESGSEIIQKNQSSPRNGSKGCNKHKWGQGKLRPSNNKEKLVNKKLLVKKAKWDLARVKCFNCDKNGHLAKDSFKPFWVSDCIAQGKLIFQRGFMTKIKAHKSEASNLLKLNYKINDKIVGCLLDL